MKKEIIGLFVLLAALAAATHAHPLGNFSVNQFSRLEAERARINLRSILDLAEIPSFQLKNEIDADRDGSYSQSELDAYAARITPAHTENLVLAADGKRLSLAETSKTVALVRPGEGDLPIIRIEWNLAADLPPGAAARVEFENKNYAGRIGWNEIVVARAAGVEVYDSTAPGSALSDELKTYPPESLALPLDERRAAFALTTGALPEGARVLQNRDGHATAAVVQKDRFAELIAVPEITPSIILFGLLVAFGLGALHAMSPGHGKTIVGAYLVGSRGSFRHAVFLGLTVTVTHTLGVFALGLVTLFASNYFLPEKMMPLLSFVSGLLVFFIGVSLFKDRLFSALGWKNLSHHHHHHHGHGHEHSLAHHSHDHGRDHAPDGLTHTHGGRAHTHLPPDDISWKSLFGLGVSGGLLPCPSALVLMLAAISLGRVGYGLVLTLTFSFGLAATLTIVGLVFLYVGKAFGGSRLAAHPLARALPVCSAFVVACLGAAICYDSLA